MRLQFAATAREGKTQKFEPDTLYAAKQTSTEFFCSVPFRPSKMDVYNFVKIATMWAAENEELLDAPPRAYSVHPL